MHTLELEGALNSRKGSVSITISPIPKENELQNQDKRWCVPKQLSIFLFTGVLKCREILHYTHNIPPFAFIQKYCCSKSYSMIVPDLSVALGPSAMKRSSQECSKGLNSRGKPVCYYGHMFPVHPGSLKTSSNQGQFQEHGAFYSHHCNTWLFFHLLILGHLQEVEKMCANQSIENLLWLGYYPGNPILIAQQFFF